MIAFIDFTVFSIVAIGMAFLSVNLKRPLYAVLAYLQAVIAVSGMLVALKSYFISFAVLYMSASSFIVFLLFSLILLGSRQEIMQEKGVGKSVVAGFFLLSAAEIIWLLYRTVWHADTLMPQPQIFTLATLGHTLYSSYAFCILIFGIIFLACMVGATALLIDHKPEIQRMDMSDMSIRPEIGQNAIREDIS